jgi:hypothetical protein
MGAVDCDTGQDPAARRVGTDEHRLHHLPGPEDPADGASASVDRLAARLAQQPAGRQQQQRAVDQPASGVRRSQEGCRAQLSDFSSAPTTDLRLACLRS